MGFTGSFGTGAIADTDFWIVKTNANGDSLWSRVFIGRDGDECEYVSEASDGGYILAGWTWSFGAGKSDFWLIKINANGDSLWSRTFGGKSYDKLYSAIETSDGGYILAGSTCSFAKEHRDFWIVKTDAYGDSLWSRTFGRPEVVSVCRSVQQTLDDGYILAGYNGVAPTGPGDAWIIKTNSKGDSLWSRTYKGLVLEDFVSALQTNDGGYILAGTTESTTGSIDILLIKMDANGDSLWSCVLGGSSSEICSSIQQTSDSGYIIGGSIYYPKRKQDFLLVKTDAYGESLWNRTFGGSGWDNCKCIQQTSDGGYILAGSTGSFGAGNGDFWLVKTGPDTLGIQE